jgi:pyocin large subunit-like protein
MLLGKQSLFIVRTIRNTQIHCVGRIYSNSVRSSQETHHVSATEPNRLMLFKETVAVYCGNHTEHTDTLCGQNAELCNVKASGAYCNRNTLNV